MKRQTLDGTKVKFGASKHKAMGSGRMLEKEKRNIEIYRPPVNGRKTEMAPAHSGDPDRRDLC